MKTIEVNQFVRNAWYVAGWSHEVGADKPFGRTMLGLPLVFFRDSSNQVVALADRCPHRAAPLSRGRVEGDLLRCLYHGLTFDSHGRCTSAPGQAHPPRGACVKAYPVVERHGWIWVWMGDAALADAAAIPAAWSLAHASWAGRRGYVRYQAPHMLICDNLLDFSHVAYVHPDTLGGTEAIAERPALVRREESLVHVERWIINDVPAPFHRRVGNFDTLVDRWHFYDFHVPGVLIMHSGVQATGTGAPEGIIANALEFRSCQAVTPESETSSHYFFSVPRNFKIDDASITEQIHADVVTAFEEDRIMIEAQARLLSGDPDFVPAGIAADAGLAHFRRLMQARLDI